jgi:hypothetical protein
MGLIQRGITCEFNRQPNALNKGRMLTGVRRHNRRHLDCDRELGER